jgi:hypothetical protein
MELPAPDRSPAEVDSRPVAEHYASFFSSKLGGVTVELHHSSVFHTVDNAPADGPDRLQVASGSGSSSQLTRLDQQVMARRVNWLTSIREWQVRTWIWMTAGRQLAGPRVIGADHTYVPLTGCTSHHGRHCGVATYFWSASTAHQGQLLLPVAGGVPKHNAAPRVCGLHHGRPAGAGRVCVHPLRRAHASAKGLRLSRVAC